MCYTQHPASGPKMHLIELENFVDDNRSLVQHTSFHLDVLPSTFWVLDGKYVAVKPSRQTQFVKLNGGVLV